MSAIIGLPNLSTNSSNELLDCVYRQFRGEDAPIFQPLTHLATTNIASYQAKSTLSAASLAAAEMVQRKRTFSAVNRDSVSQGSTTESDDGTDDLDPLLSTSSLLYSDFGLLFDKDLLPVSSAGPLFDGNTTAAAMPFLMVQDNGASALNAETKKRNLFSEFMKSAPCNGKKKPKKAAAAAAAAVVIPAAGAPLTLTLPTTESSHFLAAELTPSPSPPPAPIRRGLSRLMQVPLDICTACNEGDIHAIEAIIDEFFTEDCRHVTALGSAMGRVHLLRHYVESLQSCPDLVRFYRVERVGREVVATATFEGTKMNENFAFASDLISIRSVSKENLEAMGYSDCSSALASIAAASAPSVQSRAILCGETAECAFVPYSFQVAGQIVFVPDEAREKFVEVRMQRSFVSIAPARFLE